VLVGEGQTGAMLAFGAGLSSPGLYKVVIGVDGLFAPQAIASKTSSAAKMGQKASILWDSRPLPATSEEDAKQLAAATTAANKTLSDAKLGALTTYTSDEKDPAVRRKAVVELIRSLSTATPAKPVEAGTPK
jgi:hypothetical protein